MYDEAVAPETREDEVTDGGQGATDEEDFGAENRDIGEVFGGGESKGGGGGIDEAIDRFGEVAGAVGAKADGEELTGFFEGADDKEHAGGEGAHGKGAAEEVLGKAYGVDDACGDGPEHAEEKSDGYPALGRGPDFVEADVEPEPGEAGGER